MPDYRQIRRLKQQYGDALLFFRVGDFYEAYDDDAVTVSGELELVLTSREMPGASERVPMTGVPYHVLDAYLEKLVQKEYKIAVAESTEQVKDQKTTNQEIEIKEENKIMAGKKSAANAAATNETVNEESLTGGMENDPLFGAAGEQTGGQSVPENDPAPDSTATETDAGRLTPDDYVALADAEFNKAMREGRYAEIVDSLGGLGYSVRNVMLIKQQYPEATRVGGMKLWNYNKRSIGKGSKSIKVLAPKFGGGQSGDEEQDAGGKQNQKITGYKLNPVFDISQTYGEELKETRCDQAFIDANFDGVKNALASAAEGYTFAVKEGARYTNVDYENKRVNIKEGLTNTDVIQSMITAIARIRVEGKDREAGKEISEGKEMFNELKESAIKRIVSRRLGLGETKLKEIDFSEFNDEALARVASDLNRVKSIASGIAGRVENYAADVRAGQNTDTAASEAGESAEDIFGDAPVTGAVPDEMSSAGMEAM